MNDRADGAAELGTVLILSPDAENALLTVLANVLTDHPWNSVRTTERNNFKMALNNYINALVEIRLKEVLNTHMKVYHPIRTDIYNGYSDMNITGHKGGTTLNTR